LLFDVWFFSCGKQRLVQAALSWVSQGHPVPSELAETIRTKQGHLWYTATWLLKTRQEVELNSFVFLSKGMGGLQAL